MSIIHRNAARRKVSPAPAWGLYYRVSNEELQHPELSVPAQRMGIMRALVDPSGMPVYREYTDYASGTNEIGRAEYQQMFADAEAGMFSQLAIHKWDRFGRNLLEALQAEARLSELGVTICASNLQVDPSTYTGWMSKTLQQVLAQGYVMNLREESRKGKIAKMLAGGWATKAPDGYRNVKHYDGRKFAKWVEADPERARVIQRLFEMYSSGMSLRDVASQLDREGIASSQGKRWSCAGVRYVLTNPFYAGRLVSPTYDIDREGNWERIVSAELWRAAHERLTSRYHPRTEGRVFPLSGLLWIGADVLTGAYLRKTTSAGNVIEYTYYERRGHGRGRFHRADQIEAQVGPWLERLRVERERALELRIEYERYVQNDVQEQRRREIERRLVELEDESDGLVRMCAKGLISEAEFASKRSELAAEDGELRRQMGDLPHGKSVMERFDEVVGLLAWLPETWAQASQVDRRDLARAVFAKIEMNDGGQVVAVTYNAPFEQIAALRSGW